MPNNDLGVAHGKIRIEYDDKGAKEAAQSLTKFEQTLKGMEKTMSSMESSFNKTEKHLNDLSVTMKKVEANTRTLGTSTDILDGYFQSADTSTISWTRDLRKLIDNLRRTQNAAQTLIPPIRTLSTLGATFKEHGTGLMGWSKGLNRVGVGSAAFSLLTSRILGVNKVMKDLPRWQQNVVGFTSRLQNLAFVGGGAFAFLHKNLKTFSFGKINLQAFTVKKAFDLLHSRNERLASTFARLTGESVKLGRAFVNIPKGTGNVIVGAALMRKGLQGMQQQFSGLFNVLKRAPLIMTAATAAIGLLPAAIELAGKGLTFLSNTFLSLFDAVKTLSGGLLALPGAFALIGAGVSTVAALFFGLKDNFKNLFDKDPVKAMQAWVDLPDHLKPIGRVLLDLVPKLKAAQVALQKTFLVGADTQLQKLGDYWIPKIAEGMQSVTKAFRFAKDQVVAFLGETQSAKDVGALYDATARTVRNLGVAIKPALDGLRDIGIAGAQFVSTLSAGLPGLIQKFADWARINRESGNLTAWMKKSWQGVRDLTVGMFDLTKATATLLTLFSTTHGENALDRFAKSMQKFNETVQKSAASGTLKSIKDAVLRLGTGSIDHLVEVFRKLGDVVRIITPVITDIAHAFAKEFNARLNATIFIVKAFASALNKLQLGGIIGHTLAISLSFAAIAFSLKKIIPLLRLVFGGFLLFKGVTTVIAAVETASLAASYALEKFGTAGKVAGKAVLTVGGAASKFLGFLSGFSAAITAVVIAFVIVQQSSEKVSHALNDVDESAVHARDSVKKLTSAFIEDKGLVGKNVFNALDDQVNTAFSDLDKLAGEAPGIMDHIGNAIAGAGKREGFFGETDLFNEAQKASETAQRIETSFKGVGATTDDITAAIAGSLGTFDQLKHKLLESGEGGKEAADKLQEWRDKFLAVQRDMQKLGPGGAQLADGIKKIAEAGGDATTKLEGLRTILQGLGILKTDALDAAFAYEKGIQDLTTSINDLTSDGTTFTDVLDATGKGFNTGSKGAAELYNILKPLGDQFLANVAAGANAQDEYKKFTDQLGGLHDATGLSIDSLIALGRAVGLAPKEVGLSIQVEGKDQVTQDITQVLLAAQAKSADGVEIPVHVGDPEGVSRQINAILGKNATGTQGTNLIIKPGLNPADMAKIAETLSSLGIQVPGAPAPPTKAQLPVNIGQGLGVDQASAERTAAAGQAMTDMDKFLTSLTGKLDEGQQSAIDSGSKLMDAYASGIDKNDAPVKAVERVMKELNERWHHSPPKKGPLSAHGDAARYGGEQLAKTYASGIASESSGVQRATEKMAGAATTGMGGGAGINRAGEFLGQLSQLNDFMSHFAETLGKIGETVLNFVKFVSDPLGKGTFFGKSLGFQRDKSISDAALAQKRADAQQQRIFDAFGSGQRDLSGYDTRTGLPKITGPGKLGREASKEDIVAGIVAEGQKRGLPEAAIQGAVSAALVESGGKNLTVSVNADSLGVFQQRPSQGWGTPEQLTDPNYAINKFFDALQQQPGVMTATPQNIGEIIANVQKPSEDLRGQYQKMLPDAMKAINDALASGALTPSATGGGIAGIPGLGQIPPSTILHDQAGFSSQIAAKTSASIVQQLFPQITDIGGARADTMPYHPGGRALDIHIPNWNTPEGKALGDQLKNFFLANASKLGVEDTIWQDFWQPPGAAGHALGRANQGPTQGHFDHVHITFKDGAVADIGPGGSELQLPVGLSSVVPQEAYQLPPALTGNQPTQPERRWQMNPDGTFSEVTAHGAAGVPVPPGPLGPAGQPLTDEEVKKLQQQYPLQYDLSNLQPGDLGAPGTFQGTQDDILNELKVQTPMMQQALDAQKGTATEKQAIDAVDFLQTEIDRQGELNTAQSRATVNTLQGIQSNIADQYGLTKQNPLDQAIGAFGSMTSIAGDIFSVIGSAIETVGATKDIADTLVRGIENTEDIFKMVDDIQKFIKLGADIAGAAGSVLSAIGSVIPSEGTFGAGAAVSAAGQIAGLIQSALETVNAVIDLAQEAYRIIGSYVGDFLGYLVGGAGGFQGDVKFLLDETAGKLYTYSADNPQLRQEHNVPGQIPGPEFRQGVGNINVYGGPGTDPRDDTRQMIFQIKASQMTGALAS